MGEDKYYVVACPVNPPGPFFLISEGERVSYGQATEISNKISSFGFYMSEILPEDEVEEMGIEEFEVFSLDEILRKSSLMLGELNKGKENKGV